MKNVRCSHHLENSESFGSSAQTSYITMEDTPTISAPQEILRDLRTLRKDLEMMYLSVLGAWWCMTLTPPLTGVSLWVWGYPGLYHKFSASQDYSVICDSLLRKVAGSKDRTQTLMLARQVLYQLSSLSRLLLFYIREKQPRILVLEKRGWAVLCPVPHREHGVTLILIM